MIIKISTSSNKKHLRPSRGKWVFVIKNYSGNSIIFIPFLFMCMSFFHTPHPLCTPSPHFLTTLFPPEPSSSSPSSSLFLSSSLCRRPLHLLHPHGMIPSPSFHAITTAYLSFPLDRCDFAAVKPFYLKEMGERKHPRRAKTDRGKRL